MVQRVILDVYKAHRTPDVLEVFRSSHCHLIFVPANCTSEMQVMDLAVNKLFKDNLRSCFIDWYADEVSKALSKTSTADDVKKAAKEFRPDLRQSVLKPIHTKWLIEVISDLQSPSRQHILLAGWKKATQPATITSATKPTQESESATGPTSSTRHFNAISIQKPRMDLERHESTADASFELTTATWRINKFYKNYLGSDIAQSTIALSLLLRQQDAFFWARW